MNRSPVVALGNQKSGTTAIAALLAEHAGITATLDLKRFTIDDMDRIHRGELSAADFVRLHRRDFSVDLVKEPGLTFLWPRFHDYFAAAPILFIIRDPRANIRSILNRVQRPGDRDDLPDFEALTLSWQRVVDNQWLGIHASHYIESMAHRWNLAVDIYEKFRDDMILVKYEDFGAAKAATIAALARRLGLQGRHDISGRVDIQFQGKGDRNVTPEVFFGASNLGRIERICGTRMERFGYAPLQT